MVTVPLLPGCVSEGDTLAIAKKNIQEAIELYIEVLLADKRTPPIEKEHPLTSSVEVQVALS